MPTSIEVYEFESTIRDEIASCAQTLVKFYSAIAVIVSLLFLLEAHFGMFDGLSFSQAWLKATGMDVMPDQFVSIL